MLPTPRTLLLLAAICALLTACSGPEWVSITPQPLSTAAPAAPTTPPPTPTTAPIIPTAPAAWTEPPTSAAPPEILETQAADTAAAGYVVLISLDGCRPEDLEQAQMPNLKALIGVGTSYSGAWVGALQNNTPPGHAMMSTGSFPRRSGIIGHTWANLQTGETFAPFTLEAVQFGEADLMVESSGVPTLAGLVKARYPEEMVAALSAQKYYAAQALGFGPADVLLYTSGTDESAYNLPQSAQFEALRGRTPPEDFLSDPDLRTTLRAPGDANVFVLLAATRLAERFRPRALLINLPETDYYGHVSGTVEIQTVLERTDAALGGLIAAYRDLGLYERTVWVLAADHGMTPKGNIIIPADLYTQTGAPVLDGDQTMLPELRLTDPNRAAEIADALAASGAPGLLGAYARVQQDGRSVYQAAPITTLNLPADLNAAFLYLLDTYASPYSPDVVVTSASRTAFDESIESSGGTHNPVNWADQHILLAFSGAGVAPGKVSAAPARLVDILPTLARLLDLPPDNMDGIPLADALAAPLDEDLQRQAEATNTLGPLRDALAATGGE